MDLKESRDIIAALMNWFESQDINPAKACTAMILLVSMMIEELSDTKEEERGLKRAIAEIIEKGAPQ